MFGKPLLTSKNLNEVKLHGDHQRLAPLRSRTKAAQRKTPTIYTLPISEAAISILFAGEMKPRARFNEVHV